MSRLNAKAQSLQELLQDAAMMSKQAQKIKHIASPVAGQNGIGDEMEKEQHDAIEGIAADDPNQVPAPQTEPRDLQGGTQESINKDPASILNVTKMDSDTVKKSASLSARIARNLQDNLMAKQASAQVVDTPATGIGVMRKIAALNETPTQELLASIESDLRKLAATNPLFNQACEAVAMRKLAEEAEALAEATGATPEEASQMLGEAIASDPEAASELQGEIEAEAAGELADAEAAALQEEDDLANMAANATANLGVEVTPEQMEEAIAEVEAYAEANGVDPIDLIAAAAEEMQGAEAEDPEADAMAEEILAAAAEQGLSPEEVIKGLAGDLEGEAEVAKAEAPAEEEAMEPKTATLHKLASTRRGQIIAEAIAKASH